MKRTRRLSIMTLRALVILTIIASVLPVEPSFAAPTTRVAATNVTAAPVASVAQPSPLQATSTVTLSVISARTELSGTLGPVNKGDPVVQYTWLINEDNSGNALEPRWPNCAPYAYDANQPYGMDLSQPNPNYPESCPWPSIRAFEGYSPIVTQGTEADWDLDTPITLPAGKYLVSVMANGFKIDSTHFSIPSEATGVKVAMQPWPIPTGTIRVRVFQDNAPTNSAPDGVTEPGLAGYRIAIIDIAGDVTVDMFGNPLCTLYEVDPGSGKYVLDADGAPIPIPPADPLNPEACLYSDANGDIAVPNIGPHRYAVAVVPPADKQDWALTTTLEGLQDWDTWVLENSTGFDTEFTVAGEPFPFTMFGYVAPTNTLTNTQYTGVISGQIAAVTVFSPYRGGLTYKGTIWGGLSGAKLHHPMAGAYIALNDLQQGDTARWIAQADDMGNFRIDNVPDGNYMLTWWVGDHTYLLDWTQVTVLNGQVVDLGTLFMTGWWTYVDGMVFLDSNANGKRDPSEGGIARYPINVRRRENAVMARGTTLLATDAGGNFVMPSIYPMNQWLVIEYYDDRYKATGYTYQTDNMDLPKTVLGDWVDVNIFPVIGQHARLEIGVQPYNKGENGGIVGAVMYDVTRNETNARFQAVEEWATGVPGVAVNLYAPVKNLDGTYATEPDGSYTKGPLLNSAVTEKWLRPQGCVPRDVDGNTFDQFVFPVDPVGHECVEAPMMGIQFEEAGAAVNGNYGFTEIYTDPVTGAPLASPIPLPLGDYLVEIEIPNDQFGKPMYKVVKEEDVNVFGGDVVIPQVPPAECVGPLHTVLVTDTYPAPAGYTYNPSFVGAGGSPYQGQDMPLCTLKLATVTDQRSTAPAFTLFTDVQIPGRHYGLIIDDLNLSPDPRDLLFGEKKGVPYSPVGYYDFTNRLVHTALSDPNGFWDTLIASTDSMNCPSPSGVCTGMFRLVGNDPGFPIPNPTYDPQLRSISAQFEVLPGTIEPADLAPTQIATFIQAPDTQANGTVACRVADSTPQFFAVSKPYARLSDTQALRTLTISGQGFGATQGKGTVKLNDNIYLTVSSWSATSINVVIPTNIAAGPYSLSITADNGKSTVNGIGIHVLGAGYDPTLFEVGPGKTYAEIQAAIDAASAPGVQGLVVVYPNAPEALTNPEGAYFENVILYKPIKLQGVGPGGVITGTTPVRVPGAIIDGRAFTGDNVLSEGWRAKIASLIGDNGVNMLGNTFPYEAQVVYLIALADGEAYTSAFPAMIDGFTIQGGDVAGFPGNINQIGGQPTGQPANVVVQGGGIYANAYVRYLQISNNLMQSNAGSFGGAIRLGTPNLNASAAQPNGDSNHNENAKIVNNRIIANGGTNLAGGIGIFNGADNYEIAYNDICGNFSAEYGGGISHYGYSPNGKIHHNRIIYNRAYDEAGGVMIAGELTVNPTLNLTEGAGPVDVYANLFQSNLGNDDGGGLRFLMSGDFPFNVYNNIIVNNVSTHEGGGISMNDAPSVRVYNNTIMNNLTTATAVTSNGQPAPAGLSSSRNSALLQATLPVTSPIFSNPLIFNNIFWDNRAGYWTGGGIGGIGMSGDPAPLNLWDFGISDGSGSLGATNSLMQVNNSVPPAASNIVGTDPQVTSAYTTSLSALPWRGNPNVVSAYIVAIDVPLDQLGNYHIQSTSPVINAGAASRNGVNAPSSDVDNDWRPWKGSWDIGADEIASVFTTTNILDNFNRLNGVLGGNWLGPNVAANQLYRVRTNQLNARSTTAASGGAFWNAAFGANQEAYFTFRTFSPNATATDHDLVLKVSGLSASGAFQAGSSYIAVQYNHLTKQVVVKTVAPGQGTVIRKTFYGVSFAVNDRFGARALSDGTVDFYKNNVLLGSVNVTQGATPWPTTYATGGGRIGVYFYNMGATPGGDAYIDDFGGGNLP